MPKKDTPSFKCPANLPLLLDTPSTTESQDYLQSNLGYKILELSNFLVKVWFATIKAGLVI